MATPRIQSLDRAFSLLECIARSGGKESLPMMAQRCSLSVATAHRLLATLEALGAVIHIGPGEYRIGMSMIELARGSDPECLLTAASQPALRKITRSLCPTAHVGVLDAERMVTYVAKQAMRSHAVPTRIGSKLEAYCSGLGKVLLAWLPAPQRDAYLAEGPFIPVTKRTIIDPAALGRELVQVRRQGYAVDNCELFDDLRCVAVPILDFTGHVTAAISASAPRAEIPMARIPEIALELSAHAKVIGAKLYPGSISTAIN